jgi:hypothetical protein
LAPESDIGLGNDQMVEGALRLAPETDIGLRNIVEWLQGGEFGLTTRWLDGASLPLQGSNYTSNFFTGQTNLTNKGGWARAAVYSSALPVPSTGSTGT